MSEMDDKTVEKKEEGKTLTPIFVSLGDYCVASQILKNVGLKEESFPFDWIFSNIMFVNDCFEDEFESFLMTLEEKRKNFKYYDESRWVKSPGIPHKDINDPETFQYYKRRKEGLYRILQQTERPVVFLHIQGDWKGGEDHIFDKVLEDQYEKLIKKIDTFSTCKYRIISFLFVTSSFSKFGSSTPNEIILPTKEEKKELLKLQVFTIPVPKIITYSNWIRERDAYQWKIANILKSIAFS